MQVRAEVGEAVVEEVRHRRPTGWAELIEPAQLGFGELDLDGVELVGEHAAIDTGRQYAEVDDLLVRIKINSMVARAAITD